MVKEAVEKLIQLIEEEKTDFEEFEVLLSAEEKTILNVLKKKKRAMNINEIRNSIVDDFIKLIKYYGKINELREELKKLDNKKEFIIIKPSSGRFMDLIAKKDKIVSELVIIESQKPKMEYWVGEFEDVPELFIKVYKELREKNILKNGKILERNKRIVAELINKYGIARIPSYKTIERILIELEAGGFVVSRPDSGGKGKKLYAINPKLLKKMEG